MPEAQGLFAHAAADVGVVADRLGDDVAGAGQGGLDVGHLFGQVGGGQGLGRLAAERLVEHQVGQRLQAALAGDAGAGAPLLLVGRVEVFQLGLGRGGLELRLEFGRQLALFRDTGDNGSAALVEGAGVFERLDDGAQLFLVEAAGHFLAVAGDKGQRVAVVEQGDGGLDRLGRQAELRHEALFQAGCHELAFHKGIADSLQHLARAHTLAAAVYGSKSWAERSA